MENEITDDTTVMYICTYHDICKVKDKGHCIHHVPHEPEDECTIECIGFCKPVKDIHVS